MKSYIFLLILSLSFSLELHAQIKTCDCKADLVYLNQNIEKLPSFKKNKNAYKLAFQSALSIVTSNMPYYDCFVVLNTLLIPLKDWHMAVIENETDSLSTSLLNYPKYDGSLENLKRDLKEKSNDEIEGIYFVNNNISFGVTYNEKNELYEALILKGGFENWSQGDIVYKLIPLSNNSFKVVGAQFPNQRMISYHERINQGIFLRAGLKKDTISNFFIKTPYPNEVFVFNEISPDIDYIKVGSFSSQYPLLKEAEDFYTSLERKLVKPNLILDLRDNGGGGDRNSDILLKQLKKYVKNNTIHIITNASTRSNAEQFTVKLKRHNKVITYGDKTNGALSYEIKPDDYYTLPSSSFLVILPSKAHKKYLKYEMKGVAPDYYLDYNKSWISTIINKIEKNN